MLVASPAAGQIQCGERSKVLEFLSKKYQEAPIAAGVTTTGALVEVLTDPKGHTWTIIVTTPEGISCLVATGDGWRTMEQPQPIPQETAL